MEKLATLISSLDTVLTGGVGWMTTISGFIQEDPIAFLFCVGFVGAGFGVGLLRRVIH